jgi:hypothetical protein
MSHQWTKANAKGRPPTGIDQGACYDRKRDRIYVCGGSYRAPYARDEGKVYAYDVKTNTWSNVPDKGSIPQGFSTNVACVHYDTANDQMIVLVYSLLNEQVRANRGVYVFDPERGSWDQNPLPLPAKVQGQVASGFYCPELNAHFIYSAPDSGEGEMWVYRYKMVAREK